MRRLLCLLLAAGCSFRPSETPAGGMTTADAGSATPKIDARATADSAIGTPDAPPSVDIPDAASKPAPDAPSPTLPDHHFVTSSLRTGSTATEARSFAFDLDGNGSLDNTLGQALAAISSQIDVDAALADALKRGTQVLLHSIRAESLSTSGPAVWHTYRGDPQPNPDLTSGNGVFSIAAGARRDSSVEGTIPFGEFQGGPGFLAIELTLSEGAPPISIELVGARIAAEVGATSCAGRIGGAITMTYLDEVVLPAVALALDARIAADGNCRQDLTACSLSNLTLLTLFDANKDRVISTDEVRRNAVVRALLTPDLDLLDAEGNPGPDGTRESISIGFGFSCTRATFDE